MPRWCLPKAPPPVACDWSDVNVNHIVSEGFLSSDSAVESEVRRDGSAFFSKEPAALPSVSPVKISSLLEDVAAPKKPVVSSTPVQPERSKEPVVQPFSLSLWRPTPGFLVIDTRDVSLALPTELLLNNLLRVYLGLDWSGGLSEEVLRWPMVENRFVSQTLDDARVELQTWLAVEHELRPITRLWLMGENAVRYFAAENINIDEFRFRSLPLALGGLAGVYLPGLNQLLQQPLLKVSLWTAIR